MSSQVNGVDINGFNLFALEPKNAIKPQGAKELDDLFSNIGENAQEMLDELCKRKQSIINLIREEFLITIVSLSEIVKLYINDATYDLKNFEIQIILTGANENKRSVSVSYFSFSADEKSKKDGKMITEVIEKFFNVSGFSKFLDEEKLIKDGFKVNLTQENINDIDKILIKELFGENEYIAYQKYKLQKELKDNNTSERKNKI